MKSTANPLRFDHIFYAVSTSLLLATPVETSAYELPDEPASPGFLQQPATPQLPLDPLSANELLIGPDLFVRKTAAGNVHRAGIIVGQNNLQTRFHGMRRLLGDKQRNALNISGEGLGVYWSMTHEQGWHLDAVAMGSRIEVNGQRLDDSGHAMTFSLEGGIPIGLGGGWVIEPQAQLINQQFFPGNRAQQQTLQALDSQPSWSGRVGARLSGRYDVRGMPIEPYVRTNVWYDFSNADEVKLDQVDKISSSRYSTTVELGLGLVARVTPSVALFVSADYSSDVDDNDLNGLIGSLGVRMRW
ncbi:autotransporter outer membrane beta-barrel domain-containing protein [Pseudomonas sp. AFG_SD02_1510_Pfu_092]|uniref:autotransporter domain-containing protein n=1 Tax=Pseudomonas sp. AFG_SD02_1510_Pfu_092 TaxID=2259497 RepID=UPI000DEF0037|nr:autotransporter outer membrane beta-barrel domain-containing protein [Pseudomonas sp. AFG_SD02_1510_Pfu_092]RCL28916.1 autotransporter outer membrane beta-barrel domain-containing protein [Pseudomonas sp. AFG_SD02_1510_Pfu_092]